MELLCHRIGSTKAFKGKGEVVSLARQAGACMDELAGQMRQLSRSSKQAAGGGFHYLDLHRRPGRSDTSGIDLPPTGRSHAEPRPAAATAADARRVETEALAQRVELTLELRGLAKARPLSLRKPHHHHALPILDQP